jgi:hypothetical protein
MRKPHWCKCLKDENGGKFSSMISEIASYCF